MNNSVIRKRLKGWLALMMAVTMLLGGSLTVFAQEYSYNSSSIGNITTDTEYRGGDTIKWHVSGGIWIIVYVNNNAMDNDYIGDSGHYVVTLSGAESVVYTVENIIQDDDEYNLYLTADLPVTKELDFDYDCTVSGISVGDTLSSGDSIWYTERFGSGSIWDVTLVIDGTTVENTDQGWEHDNNQEEHTYTFDEDVRVTAVDGIKNEGYHATIAFSTDMNSGGAGSSSGSDSKKSEKTHEEIFSKKLIKGVAHAKAGDNMAIDASEWHSFRAGLLNELLAKEGVSYTFYYKYRDECFSVTVPAGTVFDESIPWYGPYKMNAMFGRTMIDESTLNAAIKK